MEAAAPSPAAQPEGSPFLESQLRSFSIASLPELGAISKRVQCYDARTMGSLSIDGTLNDASCGVLMISTVESLKGVVVSEEERQRQRAMERVGLIARSEACPFMYVRHHSRVVRP